MVTSEMLNGTLEPGIASTLTTGAQKLPMFGREAARNLLLSALCEYGQFR